MGTSSKYLSQIHRPISSSSSQGSKNDA